MKQPEQMPEYKWGESCRCVCARINGTGTRLSVTVWGDNDRGDPEMIVSGPCAGAVPVGVPSKPGACPWTDSGSCVELLCSGRKARNRACDSGGFEPRKVTVSQYHRLLEQSSALVFNGISAMIASRFSLPKFS